ncbi:MAG: cupin domain-containing protein [Candidatus Lambdaproteobacteria bacterium]|nr:cupin domain-containing protein [Candidatus Lambdaproteobacteria bacterium]
MRRVVTAHDAQGRSYILLDGAPGKVVGRHGRGMAELWNSAGPRLATRETVDRAAGEVLLAPPAGGSRFRYFLVPPERTDISREEQERIAAERFAAMGAADARADTTRHPGMHQTKTLDYIVLLSGRVTLLLDEGEVELEPFDVVVQQGTNHAWVNKGPESALLAGVLIDVEID